MKKSYLFLADGFEEIEALTVVDIMRRAEMPLVTLSVNDKAVVIGAHGIPVVADALAQDVAFDEVEWLILPGGMPGMTNLAASRPLCDLVKAHAEAGGRTAAICASPSILGMLGLLNGRRATCYPGFEHNLEGAIVTGERTAVDDNITTGNGPASAAVFALEIVAQSCGEAKAQEVAAGMLM